jgi:hypothetical protein
MTGNEQHITRAYDRDLEAIQAMIIKMGGLVEDGAGNAPRGRRGWRGGRWCDGRLGQNWGRVRGECHRECERECAGELAGALGEQDPWALGKAVTWGHGGKE